MRSTLYEPEHEAFRAMVRDVVAARVVPFHGHGAGRFDARDAAMATWWTTELQERVVDQCVQLHGGYGYLLEHPVAKAYVDARVQTIRGRTTEVMKEIIGRSLGV